MIKSRHFSFKPYRIEAPARSAGLSVDVDDIVEAFEEFLGKPRRRQTYQSRLETELLHVLDFLDRHQAGATFFISGTALKYARTLLPEIVQRGHEIGSHGMVHRPVYQFSPAAFEKDLGAAVAEIEKWAGTRPSGYRAPGLTLLPAADMAVPVLEKFGFTYSSSLPPVPAPQHQFMRAPAEPFYWTPRLVELPVSSIKWMGLRFPVCGSIYTRLYPAPMNAFLFRRAIRRGQPLFIYFHPFEFFTRQAKKVLKEQGLYRLHQRLYLMRWGRFEDKMAWILKKRACRPYGRFVTINS
jgi:peptidoglycan/xylan/chitin deacetylase (PgdA/CDA1 family)